MKKLPEWIRAEYDATKQAAKDLKQELTRSYKRVKFSVTSGYNVIGVNAINPYSAQMTSTITYREICKKYEIAHPDGHLMRHVIIMNDGE